MKTYKIEFSHVGVRYGWNYFSLLCTENGKTTKIQTGIKDNVEALLNEILSTEREVIVIPQEVIIRKY